MLQQNFCNLHDEGICSVAEKITAHKRGKLENR
uniref:Uncharacterized protein n=1 Tax=Rhizophora mucronata TaxID=61149 RepID=A0A2P2NKZ0_RHIMU